jgi:hypothetical protein
MGAPGFTPGGEKDLLSGQDSADLNNLLGAIGASTESGGSRESMGVFSEFPGATKKYTLNIGKRDNEYRETMARMFVEMTQSERELFVNSVPPETQPLARVLAGVQAGGSNGTGFIDFLLQTVVEDFSEKFQVVETLSDNFVVYMFGQKAPVFQYSGTLLNTYQDDQRVWMTRLYRDILRGTQLARRRKLLRLRYDSVIVSGVVLNLRMQLQADAEDRSPFSFTMIPTSYMIFTEPVGKPTQLETPFTDGGRFALDTVGRIPTTRLRVTGVPAAPAAATRERANQPVTSPFIVSANQSSIDSLKELNNRGTADATPEMSQPADARAGGPVVVEPNQSIDPLQFQSTP